MADTELQNRATTGFGFQPSKSGDVPPAETLRQIAEEVRAAFPRPLSAPELVLIDVDPCRVHAFWNLSPAALDRARQALEPEGGEAPMVLRFYQLSASGAMTAPFDVEVVGAHGQCYVDIWEDARLYRGELGLRRSDGSLVALTAPADVELPRLASAETGGPVNPAAEGVRKSPPNPVQLNEPMRHTFPLPPTEPSEYVEEPRLQRAPAVAGAVVMPKEAWLGNPPMNESVPPVTLPETLSTNPQEIPEPVRHPLPLPPTQVSEFDPSVLIGGFLTQPEAHEAVAGEIGTEGFPVHEASSEDQSPRDTQASVPPDERPTTAGVESFGPLPLENVLTLSSYALGREIVEFEVNAELHVFGRARPGTQLQLFGRKIPLRPDGSFSVTRPLPNGALVLSSLLVGEEKQSSGD